MTVVRFVLLLAPWAFIGYLFRDVGDVAEVFAQASALYIVASLGTVIVSVGAVAVLWAQLLAHLNWPRPAGDHLHLVRSFCRSWLARYIPGIAWAYGARFLHTEADRAPRRIIAASLVDEFFLLTSTATAVGMGLWIWGAATPLAGMPVLVVALIAAVLVGTRVDGITRWALARLGRLLPERWRSLAEDLEGAPDEHGLGVGSAALFGGGYALVALGSGLSFLFVLAGLGDVSAGDVPEAIGGYNLAATIAIAVVFVPAGLGVREATLAAFATPIVGAPEAASAALLYRAITVLADVILFFAVEALSAVRGVGAAQEVER
jgi:uncharacterized membrane protein YbhN (UPF0104 family)